MSIMSLHQHSLKYRPDIDGLRAVAVLAVVCYHIGLPLHGGYTGVDIFFTISGFLIGSIILRETTEGRFSFARFYERRIRRIIPALIAMLLAVTLLAIYFLLPAELMDFAKSLAAATFSFSNIFFWHQAGYFDGPSATKPLLHTWSLAVEEQFYILFPILLVVLHRFLPRRIGTVIYSLAFVSLLLSAYGAFRYPTTTFFWMHTRAWELLIGTALALESCPKIRGPIVRNIAAFAGLLMILGTLLLYRNWTPFPGLAAIPPCLGTALIIAAGRSGPNVVSRMLALKPVVFIGVISYSLYLWHWPLIVFHQFGFTILDGLGHHQTELLLLIASLVMAILSWRFVEVPFRTGALNMKGSRLWISAGASLAAMSIVSIGLVVSRGLEFRFTPEARQIASYINADRDDIRNQYRNGTCFIAVETATLHDFPVSECLPNKSQEKTILVLGDSHAAAMWWGLNQVFKKENVMQATAAGCKPVLHQRPRQFASCTAIMDYVLKDYLPTHKVDAVLIEAHWDADDTDSLGETIVWLRQRNIPVILVGPIVQYDSSLPRLLATSISRVDPLLPSKHRLKFVEPLDRKMASMCQDTWHIPYISFVQLLCVNGVCDEYAKPDVPLQSDYGHLTKAGSVLVAQRIKKLGIVPSTEVSSSASS